MSVSHKHIDMYLGNFRKLSFTDFTDLLFGTDVHGVPHEHMQRKL